MKRVVRKLASVSKPHIYWSGNRWNVMYLRGADHKLVSAALHFVCRLNQPLAERAISRMLAHP